MSTPTTSETAATRSPRPDCIVSAFALRSRRVPASSGAASSGGEET
jgi:hypothetical protein